MGEPLMGTPPIDDWDAGTGEQHLGEVIMGDIALPPEQPLMGKIAPPTEDE
jgi:hypothetical protein